MMRSKWRAREAAPVDAAPRLHDLGVLCEPDSREPWFICEAHDDRCLGETLERFETAVNAVLESARPATQAPFTKYTT